MIAKNIAEIEHDKRMEESQRAMLVEGRWGFWVFVALVLLKVLG